MLDAEVMKGGQISDPSACPGRPPLVPAVRHGCSTRRSHRPGRQPAIDACSPSPFLQTVPPISHYRRPTPKGQFMQTVEPPSR